MEFYINLIVINKKQTKTAIQTLEDNCIYICNSIYVMEGDIGCMLDDELDFNLIDEAVVGGLSGLNTKDKIEIIEEAFGVNVEELKYDKSKRYTE